MPGKIFTSGLQQKPKKPADIGMMIMMMISTMMMTQTHLSWKVWPYWAVLSAMDRPQSMLGKILTVGLFPNT